MRRSVLALVVMVAAAACSPGGAADTDSSTSTPPSTFTPSSSQPSTTSTTISPEDRAADEKARQLMLEALAVAERIRTERGSYEVPPLDLEAMAPEIDWFRDDEAFVSEPGLVDYYPFPDGDGLGMMTLSGSGEYFCVIAEDSLPTLYGRGSTTDDALLWCDQEDVDEAWGP